MPRRRRPAVTSLLERTANNLVSVGHACFTTPNDTTHAAVAAAILDMCRERDDCPLSAWVNGSTFHQWAGAPGMALEVALAGLQRFPAEPTLLSNALAFAFEAGRPEEAATLLREHMAMAGQQPPSDRLTTSLSFALVKLGMPDDAAAVIRTFLARGGELTANVMVNALYAYRHAPAARQDGLELADRVLDEVKRRRVIARNLTWSTTLRGY